MLLSKIVFFLTKKNLNYDLTNQATLLPCLRQVIDYLHHLHLDHLIPPFIDHSITGSRFLSLESKDLKSFGVSGDDKMKLKKKIKELNKSAKNMSQQPNSHHHHHHSDHHGSHPPPQPQQQQRFFILKKFVSKD